MYAGNGTQLLGKRKCFTTELSLQLLDERCLIYIQRIVLNIWQHPVTITLFCSPGCLEDALEGWVRSFLMRKRFFPWVILWLTSGHAWCVLITKHNFWIHPWLFMSWMCLLYREHEFEARIWCPAGLPPVFSASWKWKKASEALGTCTWPKLAH